jgi:type II secretory pathway component HofQ
MPMNGSEFAPTKAMKSLVLCLALLFIAHVHAAPDVVEEAKAKASAANARKMFEFSDADVQVVLRTLAREAKMNLVLSGIVKGTVDLRLEEKTPREVIEVIIQANGWELTEINGIYYIGVPELMREAELIAHRTKIQFDAYLQKGFTRAEAMDLIRYVPGGVKLGKPAVEAEAPAKRKTR